MLRTLKILPILSLVAGSTVVFPAAAHAGWMLTKIDCSKPDLICVAKRFKRHSDRSSGESVVFLYPGARPPAPNYYPLKHNDGTPVSEAQMHWLERTTKGNGSRRQYLCIRGSGQILDEARRKVSVRTSNGVLIEPVIKYPNWSSRAITNSHKSYAC